MTNKKNIRAAGGAGGGSTASTAEVQRLQLQVAELQGKLKVEAHLREEERSRLQENALRLATELEEVRQGRGAVPAPAPEKHASAAHHAPDPHSQPSSARQIGQLPASIMGLGRVASSTAATPAKDGPPQLPASVMGIGRSQPAPPPAEPTPAAAARASMEASSRASGEIARPGQAAPPSADAPKWKRFLKF
eukprot:tig00000325_g24094.t1